MCKNGDIYVGLTDDPQTRKVAHGNPKDWRVVKTFSSEVAARAWEKAEIQKPGNCGGTGGAGWKNGYKYTVSSSTKE